jgi:hypothetical protein
VVLTISQREDSPTPKSEHYNKKYIFIAVPTGGSIAANIVALFGF